MNCEQARELLIEYAEGELSPAQRAQVEACLDSCEDCKADYAAIMQWHGMANNWHDEVVPNWKPAPVASGGGRDWFENLRLWFPTAASTAALAMATLLFIQMPQPGSGVLPSEQPVTANYEALPPLPQVTQAAQAALVQSVMEGSREQRAEELQALLKILKAEMDRRSIETEESLRFIISNQLQGQEELDALYKQVEAMMGGSTAGTDTGAVNR